MIGLIKTIIMNLKFGLKSRKQNPANEAPYGSALEFLPLCGVIGLGRILSEGHLDLLQELRIHASKMADKGRYGHGAPKIWSEGHD